MLGPASPSLASGRTSALSPRLQRLLRYGLGSPATPEVNRRAHRDRLLRGGLGRHRVSTTQISARTGGCASPSDASPRPSMRASAMPSPTPTVGHSMSRSGARHRDRRPECSIGSMREAIEVRDDGSGVLTEPVKAVHSLAPASKPCRCGCGVVGLRTTSARSRASIGFEYSPSPYAAPSASLARRLER